MPTYPTLPWSRINDYLLEVGSVRNNNEFGLRALSCLADLVPYDNNGVLGINEQSGKISICDAIGDASKWVELHNNYYWKAVPDSIRDSKPMILDWGRRLQHTEYGADFINPQGIACGLVTPLLDETGRFLGAIAVHRSKGTYSFTEKELEIMQVIQPHLSNLYNILKLTSKFDYQNLTDQILFGFPVLTKREAEIIAMIYNKFSTSMISSMLLISPRTVHKHVENIFEKVKVRSRKELMAKLLDLFEILA